MIISFANKDIRELCEEESKAYEILGQETAKKLHTRLADLLAISSIGELLILKIGNPQIFEEDNNKFKYRISLSPENILLFSPVNIPLGVIDWFTVKRIKILEVRDLL